MMGANAAARTGRDAVICPVEHPAALLDPLPAGNRTEPKLLGLLQSKGDQGASVLAAETKGNMLPVPYTRAGTAFDHRHCVRAEELHFSSSSQGPKCLLRDDSGGRPGNPLDEKSLLWSRGTTEDVLMDQFGTALTWAETVSRKSSLHAGKGS